MAYDHAKALRTYNQRHTRKNIVFHSKNDADLLEAIKKDKQSFAGLVKSLLREHYQLYTTSDGLHSLQVVVYDEIIGNRRLVRSQFGDYVFTNASITNQLMVNDNPVVSFNYQTGLSNLMGNDDLPNPQFELKQVLSDSEPVAYLLKALHQQKDIDTPAFLSKNKLLFKQAFGFNIKAKDLMIIIKWVLKSMPNMTYSPNEYWFNGVAFDEYDGDNPTITKKGDTDE